MKVKLAMRVLTQSVATALEEKDDEDVLGTTELWWVTPDNSENLRTKPKFIVFLSQLLLLFNVCPACKSEKPFIETSVIGTMVKITTKCFNPDCSSPENTWKSQPIMTGTKMPAMNFLLCFSVLVSGASPSKIFLVFKNVGLSCISLKTYFKHQANRLFPTVHLYWKKCQEKMMAKLKATEQSLVIAGDGRHDSMGHSAKYCAYTLFCCTVPLINDFSLVQLEAARLELQAMTPAPMNTMLEKQPRDKATELWKKRKSMVVQEVPRTVQVNESSMTQTVLRKPRYCRSCKNPMKGHKNVKDCPKNM
ncbi:Hypothetical predicted protein [Paramuricea clavata]|uniref:Uncharacterized protein n=1 Tax=Paramuricea clavata TaxID=317549 RepID=A0A7D9EHA6_PARCT|nr:Hypothetical predicted protein [Paramuricea clavata]